jgi:hypothetical protein
MLQHEAPHTYIPSNTRMFFILWTQFIHKNSISRSIPTNLSCSVGPYLQQRKPSHTVSNHTKLSDFSFMIIMMYQSFTTHSPAQCQQIHQGLDMHAYAPAHSSVFRKWKVSWNAQISETCNWLYTGVIAGSILMEYVLQVHQGPEWNT